MILAALAVSVTLEGGTIAETLQQLMRQTDCQLIYRYTELNQGKVAPLKGDGSLGQVLEYILRGSLHTWSRDTSSRYCTMRIVLRAECLEEGCGPLDE